MKRTGSTFKKAADASGSLLAVNHESAPALSAVFTDPIELTGDNLNLILRFFNCASEGLCLADPDTRKLLMANETFCSLMGYKHGDLMHLRVDDLHPAEDRRRALEAFDELVKDSMITIQERQEVRFLRKSGATFFADVSAMKLVVDGKRYVMGFFRDVSDRRRRRVSLEISNQFLEIANRHTDIEPLMEEFVDSIMSRTGCPAAGIRIINDDSTAPFKAARGFSREYIEQAETIDIESHHCACCGLMADSHSSSCRFTIRAQSCYTNCFSRDILTCPGFLDDSRHWALAANKFESIGMVSIPIG